MPPPVTSGLVGQWTAKSLALGNNDAVTIWPDDSGVGNDLLTPNSDPVYHTNVLNGHPGVFFDGAANRNLLVTLATTITDDYTIFTMIRNPANTGVQQYWADNSNAALIMAKWINADEWLFGGGSGSTEKVTFTETGLVGIDCHWNQTVDGSADAVVVRANGAQKVSGTASGLSHSITHVYFGGRSGGDRRLIGYMFEMLLYDRVLDGTEIGQVEAYLDAEWSATTSVYVFFDVTDLPVDFGTADTAEIVVRTRGVDIGATPLKLFAQLFEADETTALSDEVEVAEEATDSSFTNSSPIAFTGLNTTADKSVWDAARVRFRWGT